MCENLCKNCKKRKIGKGKKEGEERRRTTTVTNENESTTECLSTKKTTPRPRLKSMACRYCIICINRRIVKKGKKYFVMFVKKIY